MAAKKTASKVLCSRLVKAWCGVHADWSLLVSKESKALRETSTVSRLTDQNICNF